MEYQNMLELVNQKINMYETLVMNDNDLNSKIDMYKKQISDMIDEMINIAKSTNDDKDDVIQNNMQRLIENYQVLSSIQSESNELKEQLEEFNKGIDVLKEYATSITLQQKLSSEIKIAENMSKKSDAGNLVETVNAEGRKKMISEFLVDDYNILVQQKKEANLKMIKSWGKLKGMNFDALGTRKTKELEEEKEIDLSNQKINIERQIQEILNMGYLPNMGKKVIIKYNNQKYKIPSMKKGQFNQLNAMLSKLNKQEIVEQEVVEHDTVGQETIENSIETVEQENNQSHVSSMTKKEMINEVEKLLDEALSVNDGIKSIVVYDGKEYKIPIEKKDRFNELVDMIKNEEIVSDNKEENIEDSNQSKPLYSPMKVNGIEFVLYEDTLNFNAMIDRLEQENKSPKLEVVETRKPKKVTDLKNKIIKAVPFAAASLIIFTRSSLVQLQNTLAMSDDINNISSRQVETLEKNINNEIENIKIGDEVSVQKNANIYDTGYDASIENPLLAETPLYDHDRSVSGVVVTMPDGSTKMYMDTNTNEYVDSIKEGGKVTAYLTNGDEGFFNSDDVSLKGKAI